MKRSLQSFIQSKTFTKILIAIAAIIAVLGIFTLGMFVGYHKARFSNHFEERYNAISENDRFLPQPLPGDHGATGTIISTNLPEVTIADVSGVEKIITITPGTIIREYREEYTPADLKVGMQLVVFGTPDQSAIITAKFIRILSD